MHIALVGPATPELLQDLINEPIKSKGYPFPLLPTLARAFLDLGHRVTVITTGHDITEVVSYEAPRVSLFVVPSRERARNRALDFFRLERRAIENILRQIRPNLVHAHWTYEFALAAVQSQTSPVLVTAHDAPFTILRHTPDAYRFVRTVMAISARLKTKNLTAVSPYLARAWRREMTYLRPITVIPNPVTPLRTDSSLRSSTPLVLGVGNDGKLKNYKALLRAFPQVLAQYPSAQLRLVGPGLDERGQLASWARQRGLGIKVTFVGPVDPAELAKEFSHATVFCHPSLEESFGMVLVEALEAGLPVVAGKKSGGVPWVLFDGQAGRLVNVKDPASIADGIISAIQNPSSTVSKGFDVASKMQQRYSVEAITAQYLREYERVLSSERGKRWR